MKFDELVKYFEDAAISNRAIKHQSAKGYNSFMQMDIEEIMTAQSTTLNGMAMILENPETRTSDALSDNPRKNQSGAVLIVAEYTKGDFKNKIKVITDTEAVCEQLIAKFKNDYQKRKHDRTYKYNLMGIDLNSCRMNRAAGLFNGFWVGWRLAFTFNNEYQNNLQLQESDWYNDTPWEF